MSGQSQIFEGAASLEKHALATVLDFIKKRNLKETEEALKKELGISASTISPASGQLPFSVTAGIHSVEIDPEKLEESYSRPRLPVIRRAVNASVSVSEDRSESLSGSDSEEEGPKSWPGKFSSGKSSPAPPIGLYRPLGAPYQLPSFGVGQVPAPITTATTTTPSPAMGSFAFKPPLVPTLFTIIPRGLISGAPGIPSALVPTVAGIQSPPLANDNALPLTASKPIVVPSSPSPSPPEEVSSPTSCLPSTTSVNKAFAKGPVTLASIPPEEMTPAYAELKAFAEEFKTKRIQLGYTQGAVGQSLAERGYSNFAQSTISRFEQMQLSASNAATIKQILERWLHETEHPEDVPSSTESVIPPRKRKKRAVFTSQTRTSLEDYFRQEARPSRQLIETIANELDLLPEEVRVWFCNKRQKFKQQAGEDVSVVSHSSGHVGAESPATPVVPSSPDLGAGVSKKRSPSPPHPNFSIEELSKSSSSTTTVTNSPVRITSQLTFSPPKTFCPIILPSQRPNISVPTSFVNPFSSTKA